MASLIPELAEGAMALGESLMPEAEAAATTTAETASPSMFNKALDTVTKGQALAMPLTETGGLQGVFKGVRHFLGHEISDLSDIGTDKSKIHGIGDFFRGLGKNISTELLDDKPVRHPKRTFNQQRILAGYGKTEDYRRARGLPPFLLPGYGNDPDDGSGGPPSRVRLNERQNANKWDNNDPSKVPEPIDNNQYRVNPNKPKPNSEGFPELPKTQSITNKTSKSKYADSDEPMYHTPVTDVQINQKYMSDANNTIRNTEGSVSLNPNSIGLRHTRKEPLDTSDIGRVNNLMKVPVQYKVTQVKDPLLPALYNRVSDIAGELQETISPVVNLFGDKMRDIASSNTVVSRLSGKEARSLLLEDDDVENYAFEDSAEDPFIKASETAELDENVLARLDRLLENQIRDNNSFEDIMIEVFGTSKPPIEYEYYIYNKEDELRNKRLKKDMKNKFYNLEPAILRWLDNAMLMDSMEDVLDILEGTTLDRSYSDYVRAKYDKIRRKGDKSPRIILDSREVSPSPDGFGRITDAIGAIYEGKVGTRTPPYPGKPVKKPPIKSGDDDIESASPSPIQSREPSIEKRGRSRSVRDKTPSPEPSPKKKPNIVIEQTPKKKSKDLPPPPKPKKGRKITVVNEEGETLKTVELPPPPEIIDFIPLDKLPGMPEGLTLGYMKGESSGRLNNTENRVKALNIYWLSRTPEEKEYILDVQKGRVYASSIQPIVDMLVKDKARKKAKLKRQESIFTGLEETGGSSVRNRINMFQSNINKERTANLPKDIRKRINIVNQDKDDKLTFRKPGEDK